MDSQRGQDYTPSRVTNATPRPGTSNAGPSTNAGPSAPRATQAQSQPGNP
jgi:hypothetical protein